MLVPSRRCLNKVHSFKIRLIFLNKRKENILSMSKNATMKTISSWRCAFFWQMLGAQWHSQLSCCAQKSFLPEIQTALQMVVLCPEMPATRSLESATETNSIRAYPGLTQDLKDRSQWDSGRYKAFLKFTCASSDTWSFCRPFLGSPDTSPPTCSPL